MKFTRREALLGGLTIPLLVATRSRLFAATAATLPSPTMVVVSGVDPKTPPARIAALYGALLDAKIPVTVAVDPISDKGARLDPLSILARTLRETLDGHSDLFEVAIDGKAFESEDPYFQLRQASDAQAALTWALNPSGDLHKQSLFTAQTLATSTPSTALEHLAGLRAAGVRMIIHLPPALEAKEEPANSAGFWLTSTGLAKTFAAPRTSILAARTSGGPVSIKALGEALRAEAGAHNPIVVHMPLSAFDDEGDRDIVAYASKLARLLQDMNAASAVRMLLPYVLYRQTNAGTAQYIVVRVDDLRVAPDNEDSHRAFTMDLLASGVPLSEGVVPLGYGPTILRPLTADAGARAYLEGALRKIGYDISTHGLGHSDNELVGGTRGDDLAIVSGGMREIYKTVGSVPTSYIPPGDAFDDNSRWAISECGNQVLSAEQGDYKWIWGLRDDGLLHLSNSVKFEKAWTEDIPYYDSSEIIRAIGTRNDAVFTIHPSTATSPERRKQIKDLLTTLSARSGTKLVNLAQYALAVAPPMSALRLIQGARTQRQIVDPTFSADAILKDDLMADAHTAWQYFDEMSTTYKGLVLGTAWKVDGNLDGYAFNTMWDVGSLLLAYCSAFKLDLIDQTRFEALSRSVITFLGQSFFSYRGARLPNAERPIGKERGQRGGFDSIDTGRLLISLKRLDDLTAHSLPIGALMKNWRLEAALGDGELHNISGRGRLTSVQHSSYALYSARGYKLWGYELNPIFDIEHPAADMDSTLEFLGEVGRRGAVATEPWTTEHIELEPSEHTKIVEDLLYMAQIRRRADTGYLTSVSEVAIDHDPWFIYQGYQFGPWGETWRVDTQIGDTGHKSADFVSSNRTISTKGAFLWLATRPGAYSTELYRFVREKCRTDTLGFVSGVYEQTSQPSLLADLNTNAVILEAIDFILSGRKALLS